MNKLDLEILELFKQLTKGEKCDALSFIAAFVEHSCGEECPNAGKECDS